MKCVDFAPFFCPLFTAASIILVLFPAAENEIPGSAWLRDALRADALEEEESRAEMEWGDGEEK